MVEYPLKKGLCMAAAKAVTVIVSGAPSSTKLSRLTTGGDSNLVFSNVKMFAVSLDITLK